MLFNSGSFALFFPIVFTLYWLLSKRGLKDQNLLLLIASFFFYACWNIKFLGLLIFSVLFNYFLVQVFSNPDFRKYRRLLFWVTISINIGLLGIFKYFNFFVESLSDLLISIGFNPNITSLQIVLPVGISFYTFHGLSYVIDVYNGKIKVVKNWIDYALFVSYFPLLVAGPIERATHLLPQIQTKRTFEYEKAIDGLRQILWGLFKKIVIADSCAEYVNLIFGSPDSFNGSTHLLGAIFFAFQIYCDFSGYSDIALGVSRLLGIELLRNFNFPYFARDIAEFWRRWHISLTTWFRDYLYIPLGGSRGNNFTRIRNTFIIFLISGFWHGANWTFLAWGFINALYFIPLLITHNNRNHLSNAGEGRVFPSLYETIQIGFTFLITTLAWVFFRSKSLTAAFDYLTPIFSKSIIESPLINRNSLTCLSTIAILIVTEWIHRDQPHGLSLKSSPQLLRWAIYLILATLGISFYAGNNEFIYFQF